MNVDFQSYFKTRAPGKTSEFGKAMGVHLGYRLAIDATCGLAQDSTFMLRLGFEVWAFERNPKIFSLLENSLLQAIPNYPQLEKLHLFSGDAIEELSKVKIPVDVIYLDPMFHLPKRTSKPRKEIQILTETVGHDEDQRELFEVARGLNPKRIVLKRKLKAPRLEYPLPDHSFRGQKIRYDIYLGKT